MYLAGAVSGLLGIGSGSLKVPAMDLAMHMPIKVSTATSNFMIGVTARGQRRACTSCEVISIRSSLGPVAVGVLFGAMIGAAAFTKAAK